MISLILSSSHPQLLHWLLQFSWTTHLTTRKVPEIEECHGGLNFGHLRVTAVMRSSTPSLSISTVSSLHLEVMPLKKWKMLEEKHHFHIRIIWWSQLQWRRVVKQGSICSELHRNEWNLCFSSLFFFFDKSFLPSFSLIIYIYIFELGSFGIIQ